MRFYLYDGGADFGDACRAACVARGLVEVPEPGEADVALAPLLRRRIGPEERDAPRLGTLIFHPSALPYHRGPDAIRWASQLGERVSAATWFWADAGLDTGPICEQELVVLLVGEPPRVAYRERYQPAGLRALARALDGIVAGEPRRVPQEAALASYESFYPRGPASRSA